MTAAALVPSVSIDALIARRDAMADRIREMHRLHRELFDLAATIDPDDRTVLGYRLSLQSPHDHRGFERDEGAEALIKQVDARMWSYLLDKSGLRSFMDATARRQWEEAIDKLEVPELTRANIEATFEQLHGARGEMFERGVLALFRSLSWDYKTNLPVRFGRRLVLRHVCDRVVSGMRWEWVRPSLDGCNRLDDLVRVMSVLDGKPEPDHRSGVYHRLCEAGFPQCGVVDLEYFALRGFRNANGHLTFTRPDLVDEMNRIIAKHHPGALPVAREAA